jgi:large subunit ribosomal protein L22
VKKCLESAIANAENNHDLDVDALVVSEAYVGKSHRHEAFPRRAAVAVHRRVESRLRTSRSFVSEVEAAA